MNTAAIKSTMNMNIRIYQPKLNGLFFFAKGLPTCPFIIALAISEDPLFTPNHIKLFS